MARQVGKTDERECEDEKMMETRDDICIPTLVSISRLALVSPAACGTEGS